MQFQRCEQVAMREEARAQAKQGRDDAERRYQAEVAHRERAEAKADERYQEQLAERRKQTRAADDTERESILENVRRNPQAPDIGATLKEAEAICRNQGGGVVGRFVPGHGIKFGDLSCVVGRTRVSAWRADPDVGTVNTVFAFYEGVAPATVVRAARKKYGEPGNVSIVNDFRVWQWTIESKSIVVSSTNAGAWMGIFDGVEAELEPPSSP
ncbi:MAG: hypothetical protein R3B13_12720 [Polyangiaceae bacterium]